MPSGVYAQIRARWRGEARYDRTFAKALGTRPAQYGGNLLPSRARI